MPAAPKLSNQPLPTTTPAGYERRFRELAAALAARFPGAPLQVTSEGTPNATGWFEVLVDGLLVFSKKNGGAWGAAVLASSCGRATQVCLFLRSSPLSVPRRAETQHIYNYNCCRPAASSPISLACLSFSSRPAHRGLADGYLDSDAKKQRVFQAIERALSSAR